MSVKEKIGGFALDKAMGYVSGDLETNLPRLLGLIVAIGAKGFEQQPKIFYEVLEDPETFGSNF